MPERNEHDRLDLLVQRLAPQSQILRVWSLPGGLSAKMTALEILKPGGQRQKLIIRQPGDFNLRRNPQAAADEFRILSMLRIVNVATPTALYLDESGEIWANPYLVMEFIEGQPNYAPADTDDTAIQMADQLARVHRLNGASLDLSFIPRQADRLSALFQERPRHVDDSLAEGRIRELLAPVWPLPQANDTVLLHGDFWPGNILWQEGRLAAVVDWEDVELGEPLSDVAISRFDLLFIHGEETMRTFTEAYRELTSIDFGQLPYWDLVAALRPAGRIAQWAEGWAELGRPDITEETMRDAHRQFVTQAFKAMSPAQFSD
jgi:aminoglycoside phosphotransferase (APT) family kinase protein